MIKPSSIIRLIIELSARLACYYPTLQNHPSSFWKPFVLDLTQQKQDLPPNEVRLIFWRLMEFTKQMRLVTMLARGILNVYGSNVSHSIFCVIILHTLNE